LEKAEKDQECEDAKKKKFKQLINAKAIKFYASALYNYEFYWESLSPLSKVGGKPPKEDSRLMKAIEKSFGSFDNL